MTLIHPQVHPTQTQVSRHISAIIAEYIAFARERFDVDISSLKPIITFRKTLRLGSGGLDKHNNPYMRLNLGSIVQHDVLAYNEYKDLARYRSIGGFATNNWQHWIEALVLHEVAHVVQFSLPYSKSKLRISAKTYNTIGHYENGHGKFFQTIYHVFREKFLNHKIDAAKLGNQPRMFDCPNDALPVKRKTIIATHPYLGKLVMLRGSRFEVVEYIKSNRKYPIIVCQVNGTKRFKMSEKSYQQHMIA